MTAKRSAILLEEELYQGAPCKYGHPGKRITKYGGRCWHCYQACKVGYTGPDARRLSTTRDLRKKLVTSAKHRARIAGIFFDLDYRDIEIPTHCPISGEPIETPSLDRVDNSKGYTKDNVAVVSWRMNRLKDKGTIEDFENILRYMKSHQQTELLK